MRGLHFILSFLFFELSFIFSHQLGYLWVKYVLKQGVAALDVGWPFAVAKRVNTDSHKLFFSESEVVPGRTDALSVFNSRHVHHSANLVLDFLRSIHADDLIRIHLAIRLQRTFEVL